MTRPKHAPKRMKLAFECMRACLMHAEVSSRPADPVCSILFYFILFHLVSLFQLLAADSASTNHHLPSWLHPPSDIAACQRHVSLTPHCISPRQTRSICKECAKRLPNNSLAIGRNISRDTRCQRRGDFNTTL